MNAAGVCQFCRCTETKPCKMPDGDACAWFDKARTVCTSPACITAFYSARHQAAMNEYRARPKKRTSAEVHELIRRRGRKPAKRMLKGLKAGKP